MGAGDDLEVELPEVKGLIGRALDPKKLTKQGGEVSCYPDGTKYHQAQ
jgi:hypothetical protein